MSLVPWYAVLGALQLSLGLWVVLAQPRRLLNWAVGALLILWAGSGVVFQLMREAPDPATHLLYARVGSIYEAPTFLLVLLVVDRLLLGAPKPRGWNMLLVACMVALLAFWVAHATGVPAQQQMVEVGGVAVLNWVPTALPTINAAAQVAAQAAAVVLAGRAAVDRRRSVLQRRQGALFGLAFALLLAQAGGLGLVGVAREGLATPRTLVNAGTTFAALGAALYGLLRLPRAFHGSARWAAAASIGVTLLVGATVGANGLGAAGRVAALSAFSLVLAVAVLRYDLGAARAEGRTRGRALAALFLGLCVVAVVAAAAWSLAGSGALPLGIALAAVLAPAALLATPLKRLPSWITRRVLLHPRDSEALRERVRLYASTLRAATGPDGRILPGAQPALATLRGELGLSQRDHDLLVSLGGDQSAGGIVAYRLALVGAAADAERLGPRELERLREELNVTERDHALVMEHLDAGSDSLSAGALFLGRYHVLQRLGEGGFGEVWLARDTRAGEDVVLKHLTGQDRRDGAALQRLRRELRASVLEDPHIVQVREVETVGDEVYLVMEHMSGGSLADALRARGRLPESEVVTIAEDVLGALATLHARGFVHRDVKPANILLDAKGVAKLGDFNIARELVSGDTIGGEGTRAAAGTFAYMPPEQARGLAARPESDLYGLAATMYEAIAGAPRFVVEGLSHREAVALVTQREPPAEVPHASREVAAVIARALARSPEDRYASAAQMREALTRTGTRAGSGPPR